MKTIFSIFSNFKSFLIFLVFIIVFILFLFFRFFYDPFYDDDNFDSSQIKDYYSEIAHVQFNCMRDDGTNEQVLFSSLKGLSTKELAKVYYAFSRRKYLFTGSDFFGRYLNLFEWYYRELNEEELHEMRKIWKGFNL